LLFGARWIGSLTAITAAVDARRRLARTGHEEIRVTRDELARTAERSPRLLRLRLRSTSTARRFSDELDEDGHRLVGRNERGEELRVTLGRGRKFPFGLKAAATVITSALEQSGSWRRPRWGYCYGTVAGV
jgi:hypothetical protein